MSIASHVSRLSLAFFFTVQTGLLQNDWANAGGCRAVQSGTASWYGGKFHGRKTASGERYNQDAMTAAHKTLPFGTRLIVKNSRNGREVSVKINDRGPFIKGRIIDLSRTAARKLGINGIGPVKLLRCGR